MGFFDERDEAPTVEVRVFRRGELIHRELCESEEEAAAVIELWSEVEGVECEVDDLSVRHSPDDILAPDPAELRDEDYPEQTEVDARMANEY